MDLTICTEEVEAGRLQADYRFSMKAKSKEIGSCWKHRTRMEKWLVLLVTCTAAAVIVLAVKTGGNPAVVMEPGSNHSNDIDGNRHLGKGGQEGICLTPQCVLTAARVLNSIDPTVDPCENFYDFACGGFIHRTVLPPDRGSLFTYGVLREDVDRKVKVLLESTITESDIQSIQNVKHLYQSCMDEDLIASRDAAVIYPLLAEFGGWPVLGAGPGGGWEAARFDFVALLHGLLRYNNMPVIAVWVGMDDRDNTRRRLFLDQTWFGMSDRSYYLDETLADKLTAYRTYVRDVAVMLGASMETADRDVDDLIGLEIDLANITLKREERRDSEALYNKMTIRVLQTDFSYPEYFQFDWLRYIQGVMRIPDVPVDITEDEEVIVVAVPYFKKLFKVLARHTPRTLANYVIWRIMNNRVRNLSQRFREQADMYKKAIYGRQAPPARWKDCVRYVKLPFDMVVGRLFVGEHFNNNSKTEALLMIYNIRQAFYALLDDVGWMDAHMKRVAHEKAEQIAEIVGFPEFIFNDTVLDELYGNMTMAPDRYFENVLSILQRDSADSLGRLREVISQDKTRWVTAPTTVNAFYSFQRNQITFPAGILQEPYFHVDQPRSMNYGGVGFLMGHEITHGFDDTGRLYDKAGNLHNWWTPEAVAMFKEKARCLIEQYSNFVSPEASLNLNGETTQGENIADNGGLKQSFQAYRSWVQDRGQEEPLLPGVNFTQNQLFFLGFAQIRCGISSKDDAVNHILTGAHSPNRFRIIGTLQNMKEFSDTFQCRPGTYMNPDNKCSVW